MESKLSALRTQLQDLLSKSSSVNGVYAESLTSARPSIEVNADVSFALASVTKLPILIHILRKVEAGNLQLDTRFTLTLQDRVPGGGVLKDMMPGSQLTLYDLMLLMMIISDNMATDKLLQLTSKQDVENEMHELGYQSIYIPQTIHEMLATMTKLGENATFEEVEKCFAQANRDHPQDPQGSSSEHGDRATPRDIARILVDLYRGKLLKKEMQEVALKILEGCRYSDRIPALLPKGTRIAHKTGTLRNVTNDAGLILVDKNPYVLVIFNRGETDTTTASRLIAQISEIIYQYYSLA